MVFLPRWLGKPVSRLSVAGDVQKLCSLAIEKADEWLTTISSANPNCREDSLPAACRFLFEEVKSSSVVIILIELSIASSADIKGYKLWYCKSREETHAKEPICVFPRSQRRILISNLQPCTEYTFRIVSYTEAGDLGHSEAKCFTKSIEIIHKNPNPSAARNSKKENTITGGCTSSYNRDSETATGVNSSGFKVRDLGKILHLAGAQQQGCFEGFCSADAEKCCGAGKLVKLQTSEDPVPSVSHGLDLNVVSMPDLNEELTPPFESSRDEDNGCTLEQAIEADDDAASHEVEKNGLARSHGSGDSQTWMHGPSGEVPTVDSRSELCRKRAAHANEDLHDCDSTLINGSPFHVSSGSGYLDENFEYCVKTIRWLECEGHINQEFRLKLLTWFSLRSTEQERRVVNTFIQTLNDDPSSLAGQLVDSFSDIISSKRPRNGFCGKLCSPSSSSSKHCKKNDSFNGCSNPTKKPRLSFISDSEIQSEFSHHDQTISRINNGSFGSCPQSVISSQQSFQLQFLRQPDHFYFNTLKSSILHSRSIIKSLVNARSVDEISLVDNATTAVSIVLQNCAWGFTEGRFNKGDVAVMLHYAYGAVKKSVQAYVTRAGGEVIEVQLPFPVTSKEEIVSEFRKALERGKENGKKKVRLAVIDHVTSMPSVVIPVKELVKICREEGVDQVFVDAAHGIGCVDVDVRDIGADFYTSNLHKWFFCPPSIAFLYCRKRGEEGNGGDLHHPVVSHEYGNGLAVESAWIGTRDYSAQLVVPAVLEFINRFEGGIDGIKERNHEKVVEMGEMLVKAWGTNLGSPPEMCGSMIMVGLPACFGISSESDSLKLRTHLRDHFQVEVPIYFRAPLDGEVDSVTGYARISHQVYNKVEDYYRFRDAVNQLISDGFTCASLSD